MSAEDSPKEARISLASTKPSLKSPNIRAKLIKRKSSDLDSTSSSIGSLEL